jgi:hypothetical protein
VAQLAERVCLPFRSRAWRGSSGSWHGRNQGSSIDFQDHRAYMPGDDPRHIDWAAYARTNSYIMKLFREEVSPRLDVVLDVSLSMSLTPAKAERSLDLFSLVLLSALEDGIDLRAYTAHSAGHWRRLETRAALAMQTLPEFERGDEAGGPLPLDEIPWRAGSLRVLISDLLVPQPPEREMARLTHAHGRPVIFAIARRGGFASNESNRGCSIATGRITVGISISGSRRRGGAAFRLSASPVSRPCGSLSSGRRCQKAHSSYAIEFSHCLRQPLGCAGAAGRARSHRDPLPPAKVAAPFRQHALPARAPRARQQAGPAPDLAAQLARFLAATSLRSRPRVASG